MSPSGGGDSRGSAVLDGPDAAERPEGRRRRRGLWAGLGLLLAGLLVAGLVVAVNSTGKSPARPPANAGTGVTWLSGASGNGVVSGEYGTWRGRDVDIAGTWADNNQAMTALWTLQPGADLGDWDKSLDIAIGAIGKGETWQRAAGGAYDDRWRTSLTNLKKLWGSRSGTLYIRFAHEMNGNWYPWSVGAKDAGDFVKAWRRFRALQQQIFPEAQLVFCVNRETVGHDLDWRTVFPGAQYVDVLGVDYYNQHPYVGSAEDWASSAEETDSHGAPQGIDKFREFARSVGLPLAVPEWSGNADEGDSPAFIRGMFQFFSADAGTGPGQLRYEIQFNVGQNGGRWLLFGDGARMPRSSAAYRSLW